MPDHSNLTLGEQLRHHEATKALADGKRRAAAESAIHDAAAERELSRTWYSRPTLDTAAALLTDLWAAGERHGVDPQGWATVVDVPSGVLDLMHYRGEIPTDGHAAQALIDQVAGQLRERGAGFDRWDLFTITLDPADGGPRWHGGAGRLALTIHTDTGWHIYPQRSTPGAVVLWSVVAPFDDNGAAVAELVHAVNTGTYLEALSR